MDVTTKIVNTEFEVLTCGQACVLCLELSSILRTRVLIRLRVLIDVDLYSEIIFVNSLTLQITHIRE